MLERCGDEITVFDLFCGAGGFSIGLQEASDRFTILGGLDMDADAVATFQQNHTNAFGFIENIAELSPATMKNEIKTDGVDLIVGGPPCKGFSSIRPNRSSDEVDYRNYLYQDYLKFVDFFEPELFVMENVPEIINHTINETKILNTITKEIEELGYKYEWKLLNSAYYGVPQARTRFILIGVKNTHTEIQFPKPTHTFTDKEIEKKRLRYREHTIQPKETKTLDSVVTVTEAISDLPQIEAGETKNEYKTEPRNEFQELMRSREDETLQGEELTHHTATNHSEDIIAALEPGAFKRENIPKEVRPSSGYSSTYSRLYPDQPSTTLTTEYTTAGASRCVHPSADVARALTVREGMRIQSFPDWVQFCGSKTSITNQVGNAVPPLLSKAIGEAIIKNTQ